MTRGTQEMRAPSLRHRARLTAAIRHLTLSLWPVFKSPSTHFRLSGFGPLSYLPIDCFCTSSLLRPGQSPAPSPPSWAWRDPFGNPSGCAPPRSTQISAVCASVGCLPLFPERSHHGPVEAAARAFWKMSPSRSLAGSPAVPGYALFSYLSTLPITAVYPGKGASMFRDSLSSFLQLSASVTFICEFFLIILFKFAVPCPHTSVSLF